jgi:hypothetical protein
MIKCGLFGDVHTVYDISIWALLNALRISGWNKIEKGELQD